MKVEKKDFFSIQYHVTAYTKQLYASLLRIGLNFPIYVKHSEEGYVCVDGHKRMSAIADILKHNPSYAKFQNVNVIVVDYARTAPPYSLHNYH